jgi:hypothetical protein
VSGWPTSGASPANRHEYHTASSQSGRHRRTHPDRTRDGATCALRLVPIPARTPACPFPPGCARHQGRNPLTVGPETPLSDGPLLAPGPTVSHPTALPPEHLATPHPEAATHRHDQRHPPRTAEPRQRDLLIALSTPKTSVNLTHVQVPKRQLWRAIGSPPTQPAPGRGSLHGQTGNRTT